MELIFVYNANSGKWNGYMDIMHKIFSPKTYPCSLCAITYGTFKIREEWAEFKETLDVPLAFLHKDEWLEQYGIQEKLPAIFLKEGENTKNWITAETLDQQDLDSLKNLIREKLEFMNIK
ncbi:hypothetical protein ABWH96_16560 [Marivirga tractuosa]|uniref:hypothetical protein n=1 Tax=Marivirga tractuosa TaxID=1006 RepID=UPI0035CFC06F